MAALIAAVGCGGDDDDDDDGDLPEVDCSMGDVPAYSEVNAITVCNSCHSSQLSGEDRQGAPADDNFDTYAGAEEHATEMAHEVYEGEMPPADSGLSLSDDQKQELYKWALCGAQE